MNQTRNDATRLTAAQIEDWRRHLLGYFPATAASELHELCDLALRSLVPSAVVTSYGCGSFDAQGLCDNCRKKISDLNDGKALCPFGAYPYQSAIERIKFVVRCGGECPQDWLCNDIPEVQKAMCEALYGDPSNADPDAIGWYVEAVQKMAPEELKREWRFEDGWLEVIKLRPTSTRVVQPSSGTLGCDGRWQDCPLEPCRTAMKCGCNKFADMDVVAEVIALLRDIESNAAVGEPDWGGIEQRIKATLSTLIRIKRQPGYMGDINGPGCDPDVP